MDGKIESFGGNKILWKSFFLQSRSMANVKLGHIAGVSHEMWEGWSANTYLLTIELALENAFISNISCVCMYVPILF